MDKAAKYQHALTRLDSRLKDGAHQEKELLEKVAALHVVDKLVTPKAMEFYSKDGKLRLRYHHNQETTVALHRHALGQLASKVSFPMVYLNGLNADEKKGEKPGWRRELLCKNLNELYYQPEWRERGGEPARFLHRIVDGELRGFLSRRFNRYLASLPLLRAFVAACKTLGAQPVESTTSDIRFSLKCIVPKVFSLKNGEHICIGVDWANSDFGSGRMTVSQTVWRVMSNTSAVLDESIKRVHIGSVIEDADIEISEVTARKEVEAQVSLINDTVPQLLGEKNIESLVAAIDKAQEHGVEWNKLKGQLSKFLTKADIEWMQGLLNEKNDVIDLPPITWDHATDEPVANSWWVSTALGLLATRTDDQERKMELQKEAGRFLASFIEKEEAA